MITAPLSQIPPVAPPAAGTPPVAEQATPTAPAADGKELHSRFSSIASDLEASDATLTSMVAGRNPVGDGWGPHLGSIAERIQGARDAFLDARPEDTDLGARLGRHVLKVAEAAGSMSIMARQRATLSEGWSSFLDAAIADARGAAELLAPPATPPATLPGGPTPPAEPAPPAVPALPAALVADVQRAIGLVGQSIDRIRTVPPTDTGDASTKDARIAAFQLNMEAQKQLEVHFEGQSAAVASELRSADARLEDANWQLAKKPSPDGRFTGVDIPGALRDSEAAVALLAALVDPAASVAEAA